MRGDVNPPVLADAGFRVAGLEVPVVGRDGKAVIDVLLVHETTNHLVACESKSGANVDERQAKAYASLAAANVVQAASLSLKASGAPTVEVLYLCLGEHADRIRVGLRALGLRWPVFAVNDGRIDLHEAEHASPLLAGPFAGGVTLPYPPIRLIPFDVDSPPEEIRPRVMAQIVAHLAQRTELITIARLTEEIIGHYGFYGHAAQNRLKAKISSVVQAIVDAEPDRFAYERATGTRPDAALRIIRTPESLDPRGRTQAYQSLGRPRRPRRVAVHPDQLDLLAELDAGDDDDDGGPTNEEADELGEDGVA
jgi:hypothetical protein